MNRFASSAIGFLAAAGLGALFSFLDLPLAWLLGPLIGAAVVSLSGLTVLAPVPARRLGQMVVGISIGLHVTAAVAATLVFWLPLMVLSALLSVALAGLLSVFVSRLARIDDATAFYAMLPGGLAEMANIGAADGARPEPIALAQALRVAMVVLLVPPLILHLGIDNGVYDPHPGVVDWWMLVPLLGIAMLGVLGTRLLRMQNGWMAGALLSVGLVSALGWPNGQMQPLAFAAAQFVIGINVGARFKRDVVRRLPRMALVSMGAILSLSIISLGLSWAMSAATGLDIATAALALAPGGMAEMATTAQVLHLGIVLITGFHVVRALTVNGFAGPLRKGLERTPLLAATRRFADRVFHV